MGGLGLQSLCKGLAINTKLDKLMLADNMIDQVAHPTCIISSDLGRVRRIFEVSSSSVM